MVFVQLRSLEERAIMKKVGIVVNSAWGAYNFRLNLARFIKESGFEVVFFAPNDGEYSKKIKQEFDFIHIEFKPDNTNLVDNLKTCYSLFSAYKKNKPDIVLNFTIKPNIYSAIIARLFKISSINNITGLGTVFIRETFITIIVKLLYRISLSCSDKVFFQNSDDHELFVNMGLVANHKCSLIPGSGVDTTKFSPMNSGKDTSVFKFLLIARIIRDKGVFEYIEAAQILQEKFNDIEFLVIGETDVNNRTSMTKKEILKFDHDRVIQYLGKTDNIIEQLAKVDCVVLPSYREGSPRSLMEASSMGVPVIATNVPGCKDIVDHNVTGLLCKVRDSADLANKMEIMVNLSEVDRKKMGDKARAKMINEYDESIVINRYLSAINTILK